MSNPTKALLGVLLVQILAVTIVADDWSLRLGASYRDFDKAEFNAVSFRGSGSQNNLVGPYGVQNVTSVPGAPLGAPFTMDYVRMNDAKASFNSSDRWSPVLGFDKALGVEAGLALSMVGHFQFYNLDTAASHGGNSLAPGGFAIEQWRHFVVGLGGDLSSAAFPVVVPGTTFTMRNAFDMDLYVLDVGLAARTTQWPVAVTVAAGPTLSIARAVTSQSSSVTWPAQGLLAGGTYSERIGDSSTKVLLGLYGAVGLAYDFTEQWAIGGEFRYDYVERDAGTSQADLDLTGASGMLTLKYRF